MSVATLGTILNAVQACLDFAHFNSAIRHVVREYASEYEECLDVSLSQQMELISGLMDAYLCLCKWKTSPYFDLGEEPCSYDDAIRLLDSFVDIARDAVSKALTDSGFIFPSQWIGTRAQTFSGLLRRTEDIRENA